MSAPTEGKPVEKSRGLVIVHTGDGKGKTTAALGTAVRAAGYGHKVLIIQFIKGTWHYGELDALARLPEITLVRAGAGFYKILDDKYPEEVHRRAALDGLELAREQIASGTYRLVILDEINYAVREGLLHIEAVLEVLSHRPEKVSVILTGRNAHEKLIEMADLVTEMKEIKHPYQKGLLAQKGIDF